jgi:hypothetical protein
MDLTDSYRVFHPASAQCTFFSATYRTFSKMEHILGHKANLSKCKVEVTPCILSYHSVIKLECNSKRNYGKSSNTWRVNYSLLNDQ